MPNTKLEWALDTAARGFPVFLLNPNAKTPLFQGSFYKATVDPLEIEEMWSVNPNSNIGVYPGADYVIIDIDLKADKDGIQNIFERLQDNPAEYLYETFSVGTPSGGYHLYYKSDIEQGYASSVGKENSDNEILGVDVRASGGYVVGPGSTIGDKSYNIINDTEPTVFNKRWGPFAKPAYTRPEDREVEPVFDLDMPSAVQQAIDYLTKAEVAISGGGGNHHTFATLANVRDMGLSKEKAIEIAEQFWNPRCEPPWSADELDTIANNVWRYAHNQPGEKGAGLLDLFAAHFGDELIQFQKEGDLESQLQDMALVDQLRDASMWGGKAIMNSTFKREMIIPRWIPAHGFTGLLAPRNTGKSVFMIDMAHRLACDMDWYGEKTREGVTAFYICGEDIEGATQYAKAWMIHHGENGSPKMPDENRICMLPITVDLMSYESTLAFTYIMLTEKRKRKIPDGKFMIFIDTWQRATSRGGMNKDEDMQEAVRNCESLGRAVGGPVMVAFHPSKHGDTADISGSAVVGNASTAILTFRETNEVKTLRIGRVKGGKEGLLKSFKFNTVLLGEKDEYGLDIDSVFMYEVDLTKEEDALPEEKTEDEIRIKTWAEAIVRVSQKEDIKPNKAICQQILDLDILDLHDRLADLNPWYKGRQGSALPSDKTLDRHLFGEANNPGLLVGMRTEVKVDNILYVVQHSKSKFTVGLSGGFAPPPNLDEKE